jgi:hypothetical protein
MHMQAHSSTAKSTVPGIVLLIKTRGTKMNITEFLEARIAEDEAKAKARLENTQDGHDINTHADRVLAEVVAKRSIIADRKRLDRSAGMDDWYSGYSDANYDAVRALATVYADHPDYRQEWNK